MIRIFFIILIALSMSVFINTAAHAVGAVVIEDDHCVLGDGEDASGLTVGLYTMDYQKEVTPSGNVKLVCKFNIPEGKEPQKSLQKRGFACKIDTGDGIVMTTDTHSVATPGGRAMLTCKYKP